MCDVVDIYTEVLRKANKPHKCTECKTIINPGEQYWNQTFFIDHEWYKSKLCLDCKALQLYIYWVAFRGDYDVCWELGDVEQFLRDSDCIEYNEETDQIDSHVDWVEVINGKIRLSRVARITIDIMTVKAYRLSNDRTYKQALLVDKALCQL